jgi:hypothetical protein
MIGMSMPAPPLAPPDPAPALPWLETTIDEG